MSRSTLLTAMKPAKSRRRPRADSTTRGPAPSPMCSTATAWPLLRERAAALRRLDIGFVAGNGGEDLVVVPVLLALVRLLHFHQVHVVDHAAVRADLAAVREHVVDRHGVQLLGDR